MSELNEIISEQLSLFIMGFAAIIIVLVIMLIVQGVKLRGMRRRYDAMMTGNGIEDLESLLINLRNQSDKLEEDQQGQKVLIEAVQAKMRGMKSKVAVKRYNAFGERGNDLSFSLAILDDNQSGIVVSSLHNRENSYIYAKPLEKGESQYPLSPEEKEVIALALQQI
ncbi:DUF4446 family protein [Paenibacillus sp. MMS20-IR301]|uniref:DUF4446 family protein n=1 Tax=Paenibacillus sp. MMS20-IR301 TaxID=2895946 RepID=UPI0028E4E6E3|nr:DUF4446 family protein [Paenibacillus sp. MMS20-IR301]WNS42241.1 DUF4446 family protein [Paenibacillus sp. MMS20-IR301]